MIVTDDGRGMQPRTDSPGLGLGLPTIGRLAALVDLREPPGGGTELTMTFVTPGVRGPLRSAREAVREPELLEAVSRTTSGAWPGEGVQRLVHLLVPELADACAVDVLDATGYPRALRRAHRQARTSSRPGSPACARAPTPPARPPAPRSPTAPRTSPSSRST